MSGARHGRGLGLFAAVVASSLLGACASRVPGRILHAPRNPALVLTPGPWTLAVEAPVDERPKEELLGSDTKTTAFIFLLFYIHLSERGNVVTGPTEMGHFPMPDLRQLTVEYLTRSKVFRQVTSAPAAADFLLRSRVHHLFAAQFVGSSVSAVFTKDASDVHASTAQFAPFGNAVVSFEIVDQRRGRNEVVWRDTVSGFSVGAPQSPKYRDLPHIVTSAAGNLLTRLSRALHLATERLPASERSAPAPQVRDGFQFNVQRTGPTREVVDLLTIEHPSGRIVKVREVRADSLPPGRPGDWLLSRRLPSGELLIGERYQAIARALAEVFDLRRVDDAYYYHFFGKKGLRPPEPPVPPEPAPPLPPPPVM
jgi:hypothetical protein